jgi:putative ABC transport system permease protein
MIPNLLRYFSLRNLASSPTRSVLTLVGVSLGIALQSGIAAINKSTLAGFQESVEAVVGKAALTVSAGEAGFAEELEQKLRTVPGVRSTAPMVEARGWYKPRGGGADLLMIFGIDLLKEQAVRTYRAGDDQVIDDPLEFLNQADSIILTKEFAAKHSLKVEDKIELATADGMKTFTVRGLLSPSGPARAYGGAVAIMDIDGARVSFGKEGKVDRIDLVLRDGAERETVRLAAEKVLGPGYQVLSPEAQTDNLQRLVGAFQGMLGFMSALALMIGVVLVANSVSVSVAERRREIGTLRALGATRAKVMGLFLGENLALGAVAGLLGAVLGHQVARSMVAHVAKAMSGQASMQIQPGRVGFGIEELGSAVLLGMAVSTLAALWPASRAMRISPVEALKPKGSDLTQIVRQGRVLRATPWVGALLLVWLGLQPQIAGPEGPDPRISALQPPLGILASAMVAPWIIRLVLVPVLGALRRSRFLIARTAVENLLRNPGRTQSNVLSLLIGLMLVITVAAMNGSFRSTISEWTHKVIGVGDITLSSNGQVAMLQVQPLRPEILDEIRKVRGVDLSPKRPIVALRYVRVEHLGKSMAIKALDGAGPESGYRFIDSIGLPPAEAGRRLFGSGEEVVMVSENYVRKHQVKEADLLELATPTGIARFRIAGIVRDFANAEGVFYLDRKVYAKYWRDPLVTAFFLSAAPGTTPAELQKELSATLGAKFGLVSVLNTELIDQLIQSVDQSFAFNQAVQLAALLVGLIGLLNTMLVSVLERTREFGMLRAIGMERGQLGRMVLIECLAQGSLGAVAAVALGSFMAWLWITVNLAVALGWVIRFDFPLTSTLQVFAAGIFVSVLAGVAPAIRASRLEIRAALEHE